MVDNKTNLSLEKVSKSFAKANITPQTPAPFITFLLMNDGEFVSLVGPSGCGKSTILKLVAGLITPTSGNLLLDGKEIKEPSPNRGMVFQN